MKIVLFFQIITLLLSQAFTDNMVLQQGRNVPVSGQALPSESIQLVLSDSADGKVVAKLKTRADKEGRWCVNLPAMKADGKTYTLLVSGKKESVTLSNIAVGEVWLCSGQSNMAYEMKRTWQAAPGKGEDLATLELQKPANPAVRVFYCGRGARAWKVADSESLAPVSALGYFFAKNVSDSLGVPVGIISASTGGSNIDQWQLDGMLFKSQLQKLEGFPVAGFLWYQGETNCSRLDDLYMDKYKTMTSAWRTFFNSPDSPFYSVLLAPHTYSDRKHGGKFMVTAEQLPIFWQMQMQVAAEVENSEIICISDLVDNLEDIHPSYKWIVGGRLAALALAEKYKIDGAREWCGPRAVSKSVENGKIVVSFSHVADGLKGRSNSVEPRSIPALKWFEIAGADGVWRPAFAEIEGTDKVVVSHPDVASPVKVRFAWRETAQPNLFNSEGLPAFPFEL